MKWVTREKAKVDRIACPWLITKFVDPKAEFLFVPREKVLDVAKGQGAIPYDSPGAELFHYKEAGDDEKLFREICRHNLLVNMLSDPSSITEETIDIQADCVRRARFNSRKVSGGGTLLGDLGHLTCRIRLLWGERDDSPFRPADLLIGEIRDAVGALDLHRIPRAGHWSAYENAPEVNRLLLEFFSS